MSNKKHLCWDAVIATYKRYDILPLCLKLAARQSAPPTKIIVIDASPNWEESRRKVITEIAVDHPKITWLYRQASFPEKEHFDPLLRYYAAGEDLDLSYRISRHGGLFESRKAKLHHFKSESGRFSPWLVSTLSVLNQAYLLKKHATSLKRSKRAFAILGLRRIPAEALKDILTMNCNFLRLTGLLFGLRCSRKLFLMAHRDISVWYPQFQKQLIDKSTSLSGSNLSPETRNQT